MPLPPHQTYTAFHASRMVASGKLSQVAVALHGLLQRNPEATPLILDDETGKPTELDLRGSAAEVEARYAGEPLAAEPARPEEKPAKAGRGRPRLGVVAREVTLLPEHWDWLASQPGGASVALRKLVHEARRASSERDQRRHAQERGYNAMAVLAGHLPGFEEASRALFAGEPERLANIASAWPDDVRNYVLALADPNHASVNHHLQHSKDSSMSSPVNHSARRELSRRARDAFPPMGVYMIRDKETGQVLVASSRDVHAAINRAQFELRLRSHSNKALQAAWNQSGPGRFDFEVVDLIKEKDDPDFDYGAELRALEQLYREEFQQQSGPAR